MCVHIRSWPRRAQIYRYAATFTYIHGCTFMHTQMHYYSRMYLNVLGYARTGTTWLYEWMSTYAYTKMDLHARITYINKFHI